MTPYLITYSPFALIVLVFVAVVLLVRAGSSNEVRLLPNRRNRRYQPELWLQDDPPLSIMNPANPQADFSILSADTDQHTHHLFPDNHTDTITTITDPGYTTDFSTDAGCSDNFSPDPGCSIDFDTDVGCSSDTGTSSFNSDN